MNRTKPYLNRLVKIKEQRIEDQYHNFNLRDIKPITTRLMEHSETIVINNSKREMLREGREGEIEHENKLLLQKIASVMNKKSSYSVAKPKNYRTKVSKSLNESLRKKQQQFIEIQNKRFLQRLQLKKPTLNLEKLKRDWLDNKNVIRRMANCDFNLTNIKSSSQVKHGHTTEGFYKSKPLSLPLERTLVIGGQEMTVRVDFSGQLLRIVADTLDGRDLKVIDIPKAEGLLFLSEECYGKPENIFSKLDFDAKTETLFLVNEKIDENPESGKTLPEKIMLSKMHAELGSQKHNSTTDPKQKKGKKKDVHSDERKIDVQAKESKIHQKANKATKVETNQHEEKKVQPIKMHNSAENQKIDAHGEVYEEEKFQEIVKNQNESKVEKTHGQKGNAIEVQENFEENFEESKNDYVAPAPKATLC